MANRLHTLLPHSSLDNKTPVEYAASLATSADADLLCLDVGDITLCLCFRIK